MKGFIIKTAVKNMFAAKKRTWLNVIVLSLTLVIVIGYNGINDGWIEDAKKQTRQWETGNGQLWHPGYDKYDLFTLVDAHGIVPAEVMNELKTNQATPVLMRQGTIFPEGRAMNILIKGIDPAQSIVKVPSYILQNENHEPNAIIGKRMAQASGLKKGDRMTLRWRDKYGTFDAQEILISEVFDSKVAEVDAGSFWMNLESLRKMTSMEEEATIIITSDRSSITSNIEGWKFMSPETLMADLDALAEGNKTESVLIFIVLMAVALLAVFDTQTLSIFRRQKEIATYIALGMTPKQVVCLFTLEGLGQSILAILVSLIWGTPLLYWFTKVGRPLPEAYSEMGLTVGDRMYPAYHIEPILTVAIAVILTSALVCWIPARKISKKSITETMKGKSF